MNSFIFILRAMGNFSPCVHARRTRSYLSHHTSLVAMGVGRPVTRLLWPRLERWKSDLGSLESKLLEGRDHSV